MPAGRPSEYDPALCDILDAMGNDGEGMAEAIVACGIAKETFYRWQELYPEFSNAVNRMKQRSQSWWEAEGRKATFGKVPGFNATSFIFNMKNRFKEDWSDTVKSEHTGKDGGAMELNPGDLLMSLLDAKSARSSSSPPED